MDNSIKAPTDSPVTASELWAELADYRFQDQWQLISTHGRFVTWGLCELLCRESLRLVTIDPGRAVEVAELAVLIADLLKETGPEGTRRLYRLRGYAWAHDGNARRVLGDLRNADESFALADAWWEAGEEASGEVLDFGPVLVDLKASLRIAQRRFPEALSLLDRLYALHVGENRSGYRDAHLAGRALVRKALALSEMEEPELSIALLQQAEPLVDGRRDPRLLLCLQHNLLVCLAKVGDFRAAQGLLPKVAGLCRELANPLDLVRLHWAEGQIAAGLGHTEAAIQIFEAVRQEFAERRMGYDAALVTLDLTVLHAKEGHTSEVKRLSLEMAKIFRVQDVPREALAALLFFQKAAERESATATLAREIAGFLAKFRGEPDLRFERMS